MSPLAPIAPIAVIIRFCLGEPVVECDEIVCGAIQWSLHLACRLAQARS